VHLFREQVELEQRHLHSEQQAALQHQHNAPDTQLALPYSTRQAMVRPYDPAVALAAHHLLETALVVKRIPAQHGLELVLAVLRSVPHSGHQNDVRQW
jgi:hypothetical protein